MDNLKNFRRTNLQKRDNGYGDSISGPCQRYEGHR